MNKIIVSLLKSHIRQPAIPFPLSVTLYENNVAYVVGTIGISMLPTIEAFDYVFLSRISVRKYGINRGQIVSLISPQDPNEKLCKRVIALEGDTVVNRNKGKVVVPVSHCWVEGDHQSVSMDSNTFGPISVGLITAKAVCIVWPPNRWQMLDTYLPNHKLNYYFSRNPSSVKYIVNPLYTD